MKRLFISFIAMSAIVLASCGNNKTESKDAHANHNMPEQKEAATEASSDVQTVAVTYTSLDPKISSALSTIINNYFEVKNALVNDNSKGASEAAAKLSASIKSLDKSYFAADQKASFDKVEASLKSSADAISSASDIKAQREQFITLSDAAYAIAKDFGAGKAVYREFCPMARDNNGAYWVSESKEVKNPYFGAEMLECGEVKEVIQ